MKFKFSLLVGLLALVSSMNVQADDDFEYPATCAAITRCWNGMIIQCRTFGWGCTWYTIPGNSVQCTGYDGWGRYVNFYYRCF